MKRVFTKRPVLSSNQDTTDLIDPKIIEKCVLKCRPENTEYIEYSYSIDDSDSLCLCANGTAALGTHEDYDDDEDYEEYEEYEDEEDYEEEDYEEGYDGADDLDVVAIRAVEQWANDIADELETAVAQRADKDNYEWVITTLRDKVDSDWYDDMSLYGSYGPRGSKGIELLVFLQ